MNTKYIIYWTHNVKKSVHTWKVFNIKGLIKYLEFSNQIYANALFADTSKKNLCYKFTFLMLESWLIGQGSLVLIAKELSLFVDHDLSRILFGLSFIKTGKELMHILIYYWYIECVSSLLDGNMAFIFALWIILSLKTVIVWHLCTLKFILFYNFRVVAYLISLPYLSPAPIDSVLIQQFTKQVLLGMNYFLKH